MDGGAWPTEPIVVGGARECRYVDNTQPGGRRNWDNMAFEAIRLVCTMTTGAQQATAGGLNVRRSHLRYEIATPMERAEAIVLVSLSTL